MTHVLEINVPSAIPSPLRRWATSVQHQLPYPAQIAFRTTSAFQDSPVFVRARKPTNPFEAGYESGSSPITCQLAPVWDLKTRVNVSEVFLAGMSRAVRYAQGDELDIGDGTYRIIDNRAEAIAWLKVRRGTHLIALDIEGDGDPSHVHPSRHDILCLGLYDGFETVILPEALFDGVLWPELADALEECKTAAHNGKFDAAVLGFRLRGRNRPIRITHDTMMAHYALWPAGGEDGEHEGAATVSRAYHGLKILGDLYLNCGNWSLSNDQYKNMRDVYLHELYRYNSWDVQRTYRLVQIFRNQFRHHPEQLKAYWNILMPASHHLCWMEGRGVVVDVPYVKSELLPQMTSQVLELTRNLIQQVDKILPDQKWPMVAKPKRLPGEEVKDARRFNPGSADQVRTVLEAQGVVLPPDRKSKTKKGSTSKRNLGLLLKNKRKGDPFLTELLERRRVEKLLGTYVTPLATRPHTDHPFEGTRIFPSFHMHKTLTGRLAASGPNIQNQPKYDPLRRAYVARGPGRCVMQSDYGQAELRVMAVHGHDHFLRTFFTRAHNYNKGRPKNEWMDLFDTLLPTIFPDVDFEENPHMKKEKRRQLKACVPLDTEILTKRGWLKHDEVREGDETPAFDGLGRTVWSKISHVHHMGKKQVQNFGHSRWNFRVTDDHRWLTGKWKGSQGGFTDHRMTETRHIGRDNAVYVTGTLDDAPSQFLTDDEVRIISWVQSVGNLKISEPGTSPSQGKDSARRCVVMQIMQAKPECVKEIDSLMRGVPHSVAERPGVNHPMAYTWRISSPWARDLLTRAGLMDGGMEDFILRLPPHQRRIWLDTFWKTEGHCNGKQKTITQKSGEKADAFILCASLCGYHPRVSDHSTTGVLRIHLSAKDYIGTATAEMTPATFEDVWCVTTEHGTWTARQGRNVAVTGNCVYGLSFGRGAKDISEDIECHPRYAQKIIDDYLASVPGVTAWRQDILHHVNHNVPLVSRLGRYLLHEPLDDKNRADIERRALSFIPQSSASDCCLLAAIELGKYIQDNELDWEMSALIHDAIVMDIPEDDKEHAKKVTENLMETSAFKVFPEVPFSVDTTFGQSWAEL